MQSLLQVLAFVVAFDYKFALPFFEQRKKDEEMLEHKKKMYDYAVTNFNRNTSTITTDQKRIRQAFPSGSDANHTGYSYLMELLENHKRTMDECTNYVQEVHSLGCQIKSLETKIIDIDTQLKKTKECNKRVQSYITKWFWAMDKLYGIDTVMTTVDDLITQHRAYLSKLKINLDTHISRKKDFDKGDYTFLFNNFDKSKKSASQQMRIDRFKSINYHKALCNYL